MVAGGHFAGVVVQVRRPDPRDVEDEAPLGKKKKSKPKPEAEVLRHKTFHRYTSQQLCPCLGRGPHCLVQHVESRAAHSP